jgi:hypothetical protein
MRSSQQLKSVSLGVECQVTQVQVFPVMAGGPVSVAYFDTLADGVKGLDVGLQCRDINED